MPNPKFKNPYSIFSRFARSCKAGHILRPRRTRLWRVNSTSGRIKVGLVLLGLLTMLVSAVVLYTNVLSPPTPGTQEAQADVTSVGRLFYSDTDDPGLIKFQTRDNSDNWSAEISSTITPTSSNISILVAKHAPTRNETFIGTLHINGSLGVTKCTGDCDAASDFTGDTGDNFVKSEVVKAPQLCNNQANDCDRAFGLAYEQLSGDALVVFAKDNTVGVLEYCTFDGTSWSGSNCATPSTLTITGATTHFKRVRLIPEGGEQLTLNRTNRILLLAMDRDTGNHFAAIWDGSSWGHQINLLKMGTSGFRTDTLIGAWETTGAQRAVVVFETSETNVTDQASYATWDGTAWSASSSVGTFEEASTLRWMVMKADPKSDRLCLITQGFGAGTSGWIWRASGSDGFTRGNIDVSGAENSLNGAVGCAWEKTNGGSSDSQAIFVWGDSAAQDKSDYFTWDSTNLFGATTDMPGGSSDDPLSFGDKGVRASPNGDTIMVIQENIDTDLESHYWDGSTWPLADYKIDPAGTVAGGDNIYPNSTNAAVQSHGYYFIWNPYVGWSRNWRFYSDVTSNDPSTGLAAENTRPTGIAGESFLRLRFQIQELANTAETDARKKLQYVASSTCSDPDNCSNSNWTDVGDTTDTSAVWRYATSSETCSSCLDGTAIATARLTGTTQNGTYIGDKDNTPGTAMDYNASSTTEVDFPLKAENVASNETYFFRVFDVTDNTVNFRRQETGGTDCLSAVCAYPSLTIAPPVPPAFEQSGYGWFNNVDGTTSSIDVASNVVDTSPSITQREVFWDSINSLWWAFYYNGSLIEYSNSSNGSSWTSRGTTGVSTNDFSVWPVNGSTTLYLAYRDTSVGIKAQQGTLSPTSISWGSATTVDADTGDNVPVISRDSNGKLWVVYRDTDGGVCFTEGCTWYINANRSTNPNDTSAWDTQKIVDSLTVSAGDPSGLSSPTFAPLSTAGDMYFLYSRNISVNFFLKGRLWDDSLNDFGTIIQIDSSSLVGDINAVSAATDVVHALYRTSSGGNIIIVYTKYSSGSWGATTTLGTAVSNNSPSLTIDNTNNDDLYAFWIPGSLGSTTIVYSKGVSPYGSGDWSASSTLVSATGNDSVLTSAYRDGNGYVSFIWTEGTVDPYNVRFYGKTVGGGNAVDIGSPLAATNTPATAPAQGTPFRLRTLVHVATATLSQSGQNFKLQFAQKFGGICDDGDEAFFDVSPSSGEIRYHDNTNATSGNAFVSTSTDPTHSSDTIKNQTYRESNNFTNTQSAIAIGEDGMWDFALVDNSASGGTAYCFKIVKSDGTALDGYSEYPEITTFSTGFTISGNAKDYDESTNLSGVTVRVAYNSNLQPESTTTDANGDWTISLASTTANGDIVTVWIDNVATTSRATAVTKYGGVGNITSMQLYRRHLTLGSDDLTTITNADLNNYTNANDPDVMHEVTAGVLTVDDPGALADEELHILSTVLGVTYTPGGNVNTHDLDNNALINAQGNTFTLSGSFDTTGGTFNNGTSTVDMTGTNEIATSSSQGFYNLTITGTITLNDAALINNDLTISGTLTAPASLSVGRNFTNNGTFTHNSGTVTFIDNSTTTTITGTSTFNNLTATTTNKVLEFATGQTQTINGALTITGTSGNEIIIHSNSSGTQWLIDHQGTESVSFVKVRDSDCAGGSTTITVTTSTNQGNNGSCWDFGVVGITISGNAKDFDQTTNLTSGTVRAAVSNYFFYLN